jgi:hypothetical protein
MLSGRGSFHTNDCTSVVVVVVLLRGEELRIDLERRVVG